MFIRCTHFIVMMAIVCTLTLLYSDVVVAVGVERGEATATAIAPDANLPKATDNGLHSYSNVFTNPLVFPITSRVHRKRNTEDSSSSSSSEKNGVWTVLNAAPLALVHQATVGVVIGNSLTPAQVLVCFQFSSVIFFSTNSI